MAGSDGFINGSVLAAFFEMLGFGMLGSGMLSSEMLDSGAEWMAQGSSLVPGIIRPLAGVTSSPLRPEAGR